jgi:RNA polymerase sigma-70 factor (ECF subfamily)
LQPSDAADVLQEVFQAVTRGLVSFRREREEDTFRGWLWTIARNKLRDHHRRRQDRPQAIGGSEAQAQLAEIAADGPNVEPTPLDENNLIFRRGLELVRAEFEERTWLAFLRTTVDGASPADVAAELGITVNAVYKAKSRVLARLREEFQGLLD